MLYRGNPLYALCHIIRMTKLGLYFLLFYFLTITYIFHFKTVLVPRYYCYVCIHTTWKVGGMSDVVLCRI